MSASAQHRLTGLEPDNLLAFMALLGLLRALDTARPEWRARAYWDIGSLPLRPIVSLAQPVTVPELCDAAADGVAAWREALKSLVRKVAGYSENSSIREKRLTNLTVESRTFRALLDGGLTPTEQALVEGLCCEAQSASASPHSSRASVEFSPYQVQSTALKFPSGQMAFVGTMIALTSEVDIPVCIKRSLFERWTYAKRGMSLRLSPDEAKRYALQAEDPGPQGAWTEQGATTLAVLGFPSFPMTVQRSGAGTVSLGFHQRAYVRWPIWSSSSGRGASLTAVDAILKDQRLMALQIDTEWRDALGLIQVMQAYVFKLNEEGNYRNVTRALPVPTT